MKTKKLTYIALLTAVALIIFVVESYIPVPVPIPGVKLGLANIITLYALWTLSPRETLCILLTRIFLGSIFAGQIMSLLYSLSGGLLCFVVTLIFRHILNDNQIWICSIIGAISHNVGQIVMAIFVTSTPGIVVYLPFLLITGIISGIFTGLAAQELYRRMKKNTALQF